MPRVMYQPDSNPDSNFFYNNIFGAVCGFIGGGTKFLLDLPKDSFQVRLLEAVFTAIVCAATGAFTKYLIEKWLKKPKKQE